LSISDQSEGEVVQLSVLIEVAKKDFWQRSISPSFLSN